MIIGRSPLLAAGVVALGAMLAAAPTMADDAVKKLLGRAQSKSESQAVEELIRKLQGPADEKPPAPAAAAPKSEPPTQEAAKTPPAAETVAPPPPPATASQPPEAVTTPPPVETAKPAPAPAPEPETAKAPAAPEPEPVATPPETKEAKSTPPPISAEAAQEKADRNELPTADLEVYFEYRSAKITPQAMEVLNTLGRALADGRLSGNKFLIAGHTDALGQPARNLALSQRRAESVRDFLIENFSIDAGKLEAKGFGEARLKNEDDPNADENRRVQIINVSAAEARQ